MEDALVYYLEFFSGNCWNLIACTHCKTNTNFFCHEEGVREQVQDFLPSNTSCSENLPFHVRKTRSHHRKTWTVQHTHTEETNYKNVFLQPENVLSKGELQISYTATIVTSLSLFIQTFSKHSSPEMRNFLQHFPASSYLKCGMFKIKTLFNNVWVEALHHWWEETHLPAINQMIHGTCLLLPTVTLQFENSAERAYLAM